MIIWLVQDTSQPAGISLRSTVSGTTACGRQFQTCAHLLMQFKGNVAISYLVNDLFAPQLKNVEKHGFLLYQ